MHRLILFCSLTAFAQTLPHANPPAIVNLPSSPPDAHLAYGSAPQQFADLRLPKSNGPHPVAIVIHGGCWAEYADHTYTANLATRLTEAGVATWNIEYRRIHEPGGGWPGTLQDVAHAADHLRQIAAKYNLNLAQIVAAGHSSGGHLALWLAGRKNLPSTSPLYTKSPLPLKAVVNIAGIPDLDAFEAYGKNVCGERHLKISPGHSSEASPRALLPFGIRQIHIFGGQDKAVPHHLFTTYFDTAKSQGDDVSVLDLADAGHHDFFAPARPEAESVLRTILHAIGARP